MHSPQLSPANYRADLVKPHVESFDFFLKEGLKRAIEDLPPVFVDVDNLSKNRPAIKAWYKKIVIFSPKQGAAGDIETKLFPTECRERSMSYSGNIVATIAYQYLGMAPRKFQVELGKIPIMVMSSHCNLYNFSGAKLIRHKEEETEVGGFFVVGGHERLIRMIILPRRNKMMALKRPQFKQKMLDYSEFAVSMRCVKPDQTGRTVAVHYLTTGLVTFKFFLRRKEYFVPAVMLLKALAATTDRELFERLTQNDENNQFVCDRALIMLRDNAQTELNDKEEYMKHFGNCFRSASMGSKHLSDEQCAERILDDAILVHCNSERQKFDVIIAMIQRLFALVEGKISPDNADAHSNQEILLPGHLYGMVMKEELNRTLGFAVRATINTWRKNPRKIELENIEGLRAELSRVDIGKKMEYFMKTGNVPSPRGIELSQTSGFTLLAEHINFNRFLAFFRSVFRGSFFAKMRSTNVRKLLPETWGFLCPVHSPDGSQCGLLYHLTGSCEILTSDCAYSRAGFLQTLYNLGLKPTNVRTVMPVEYLPVFLDGIPIGRLPPELSINFLENLRAMKVCGLEDVPTILEIYASLDPKFAYTEIVLSTEPGRAIRPVKNIACDMLEWIGPQEQTFMNIAVRKDEVTRYSTHIEITPINILSHLASQTPFSDNNQSPRNMYQCQMAKQTMGTPFHAFPYRSDNKYYRLQTPQKPIVFNEAMRDYKMNDYATGTNAIVAVLGYTGYTMEDAMIINKSAFERGICHGTVYKTDVIDLNSRNPRFDGKSDLSFGNIDPKTKEIACPDLDTDGFPRVGTFLETGSPYYCKIDAVKKTAKVMVYKYDESCFVEAVKAVPTSLKLKFCRVKITLRYRRNPSVGDKFASRAGQKGTMSQLWPQIDMPFTDSGITPDIIINPHAFPSRMTIGMLIESVAGKGGAMRGKFVDSTPFKFNETNKAVEHFGEQLSRYGFNYYGNEVMHSGITGDTMEAEIFIGVVNYQRLRHMVKDKFQTRATGMVQQQTKQPVKGRKKHGGIRLGEMERDSLLAHGTMFLLQDRMLYCSDYHKLKVCSRCGSTLSVLTKLSNPSDVYSETKTTCLNCETSQHVSTIEIPFVCTYLICELLSMNIRLTFNVPREISWGNK